jgi:hypothetical protein
VLIAVDTGCRGGQGSPRAVVPSGEKETIENAPKALLATCFKASELFLHSEDGGEMLV